jgi:hypothetical protein
MHSTHLSYHDMIKPDWMDIHTKIEMVFALAIFNYELNYERCAYYTLPITVIYLNAKWITWGLLAHLYMMHYSPFIMIMKIVRFLFKCEMVFVPYLSCL